ALLNQSSLNSALSRRTDAISHRPWCCTKPSTAPSAASQASRFAVSTLNARSARCQVSCPPTSTSEMWKRSRTRSRSLRTTLRFSFSEWLCSTTMEKRQTPTYMTSRRLERRRLLDDLVGLDHVADLDVVEAGDLDTALVALLDLADVVLEATQA